MISFLRHVENAVSAGEVGSTNCLSLRTMYGTYNSKTTINSALYVCTVKRVEAGPLLATATFHGLFRLRTQASLMFRTTCMNVKPVCLCV
jgi:hypothetical protein